MKSNRRRRRGPENIIPPLLYLLRFYSSKIEMLCGTCSFFPFLSVVVRKGFVQIVLRESERKSEREEEEVVVVVVISR